MKTRVLLVSSVASDQNQEVGRPKSTKARFRILLLNSLEMHVTSHETE